MRNFKFGILFVTSMLLATACGDSFDYDYGDFLDAFVTYKGESNGRIVLSGQAHDDSPEFTLYAKGLSSTDLGVGERLYIRYTIEKQLGENEFEVTIDGASRIVSGKLQTEEMAGIESRSSTPFTVTSIWRTGNYVNFNLWVPYVGGRFGLDLMAVKEDADNLSETVRAKIVYDIKDQQPAFERKCYASFDISDVWSQTTCKRLRIYVGEFTDDEYYEFNK